MYKLSRHKRLTFFISGALGAAISICIMETSANGLRLNPFALPAATAYSNVFVLFVPMVSCAAIIFSRAFAHAAPALPEPEQEEGSTVAFHFPARGSGKAGTPTTTEYI